MTRASGRKKPGGGRFSSESLVLGVISIICDTALHLLMPAKPFGPHIIEVIDPEKQFLRYAFILFILLLLGTASAGTSVVAIVAGIKDFAGIDRGLYIEKGRGIYVAGLVLGITGILLLLGILLVWTML